MTRIRRDLFCIYPRHPRSSAATMFFFVFCPTMHSMRRTAHHPVSAVIPAIGTPRIAVIIPAWNEEGSIGRVIDDLPKEWVQRVLVADNNSTDYTADVARKFGATVIPATRQGYGSACLAAIEHLTNLPADQQSEVVVFVDADYSDHPEQLPLLASPILEN